MTSNRIWLTATLCAALAGSTGCATIGGRFGDDINQLQVGVTTKPQAVALLGQPTAISTLADGVSEVSWTRVAVRPGIRHTRTLAVDFGPDGRMLKIESKVNSYNILEKASPQTAPPPPGG